MKAYKEWNIEDFIDEESFIHYALKSNLHDIAKWESIIKNNPEIEETIQKALGVMGLLASAIKTEAVNRTIEQKRFEHRILIADENDLGPDRRFFRGIRKWFLYAAAAVVFISIGMAGLFLLEGQYNAKAGICRMIVAKGQKSVIILPDSTIVTLNSESELSYATAFGKTHREVTLIGEAYFKVTHDAKHPFVVHANALMIKVYGTEFNLKCYKDDKIIETTLVKGSLSISQKNSKEIFLKPNQQYVYSLKPEVAIVVADKKNDKNVATEDKLITVLKPLEQRNVQVVDPFPVTAWKDKKLVFDDDSFSDMVIKLERWYDVKVIVESEKVKQYRYKGTFESETIEQALSALKFATPFNYTITKRTIIIKE